MAYFSPTLTPPFYQQSPNAAKCKVKIQATFPYISTEIVSNKIQSKRCQYQAKGGQN